MSNFRTNKSSMSVSK